MFWLSQRRNILSSGVSGEMKGTLQQWWSITGVHPTALQAPLCLQGTLGTWKHKKSTGGDFLLESPDKISSSGFVLKFAIRWEQRRRCLCCVFFSFLTHPSVSCLWFCLTFKGPLQPKLFCGSLIHELFLLSAPFCTQEENHSAGGIVPVALQQECCPV